METTRGILINSILNSVLSFLDSNSTQFVEYTHVTSRRTFIGKFDPRGRSASIANRLNDTRVYDTVIEVSIVSWARLNFRSGLIHPFSPLIITVDYKRLKKPYVILVH